MFRKILMRSCKPRGFSSIAAKGLSSQPITIENFRNVQLNYLKALKLEQFDKAALYHLIGDFLVKPEQPDLLAAERLLNAFRSNLPEIDAKGELVSLYIIQLFEWKNEESPAKAVDLVCSILEQVEPLKSASIITPFVLEFIWENLIKTHSNDSAHRFYDACKKHSALIESTGFSFDNAFKERLLLELFLPCRNQALTDRIVADSLVEDKIGISCATLYEIFKVFVEPEIEDPYPEPEIFSPSSVIPRFHALVSLLQRWKDSGIPIKGESVSKALASLFQNFLPSNSMIKRLESVI